MKTVNTIIKVLTALATVAGVVYLVATYGEQIVEWAKKLLSKVPQPACVDAETVEETVEEPAAEEAEEAPAEEAAEEAPAEEPAPEVVVAENEPVAEDHDFAE